MAYGHSSKNINCTKDVMVLLKFSPNSLVPQLGLMCSEAWMNKVPLCWLCPKLFQPCTCIHTICGIGGNISTASGVSCNNPHYSEDGIVCLDFSPEPLVPKLGYYEDWMIRTPVYWLGHRREYLSHVPTSHVEWVATHPWPVVIYNNTHHHDDGMVVLHILPNLVPQLGYYVA